MSHHFHIVLTRSDIFPMNLGCFNFSAHLIKCTHYSRKPQFKTTFPCLNLFSKFPLMFHSPFLPLALLSSSYICKPLMIKFITSITKWQFSALHVFYDFWGNHWWGLLLVMPSLNIFWKKQLFSWRFYNLVFFSENENLKL